MLSFNSWEEKNTQTQTIFCSFVARRCLVSSKLLMLVIPCRNSGNLYWDKFSRSCLTRQQQCGFKKQVVDWTRGELKIILIVLLLSCQVRWWGC